MISILLHRSKHLLWPNVHLTGDPVLSGKFVGMKNGMQLHNAIILCNLHFSRQSTKLYCPANCL